MRRPGCAGRVRPHAGYERRHTVPFLRAVRKAAVSVRRPGAMVRLMSAAARRGSCRQGAWRRRYSRSVAQSLRSEIFQNDNKRRLPETGSLRLSKNFVFPTICVLTNAEHGRPKVPMRKLSPSQSIQTEVHAPGLDAFAQQTLLNARCRASASTSRKRTLSTNSGFPKWGASFCVFSAKRAYHENCRKISRTIPVSPPE